MKSPKSLKLLVPVFTTVALVTTGLADNVVKANNANNLNLTTSWVSGNTPGASDVAYWDHTITAANSAALGADLSWLGIALSSGVGGDVTISGASNTLTLGASGINNASSKALNLTSLIALNASQAWSGTLGLTGSTITNNGYDLTLTGRINLQAALDGTGGLTKTGGLTLTISGNSTYTGTTTINDGILQLGGGGGRGSISGASLITGNGRFRLFNNGITDFTIANTITGSLAVDKYTNGNTAIITGANSYTGKTSVAGGAISVSSINSVSGGAATSNLGAPVTIANGTIDLGLDTASVAYNASGTLIYTGSGETTDRVINLSGLFSSGVLDQSGSGVLKFTSAVTATGVGSKALTLKGSTAGIGEIAGAIADNTTRDSTKLTLAFSAGATTVKLASVDGISIGSTITGAGIAAGTTITAIDTATRTVTLSTATTGVGAFEQNIAISGLRNDTSVLKTGTGTWILSGVNTYTGDTVIESGALNFTETSLLSFIIGADGVNNRVRGAGSALFDGAFSFDLSSASTDLNASWMIVDIANLGITFGSAFNVSGFISSGGGLWETSYLGTSYLFDETTGVLAVIPEPSMIASLLFGMGVLIGARHYRRG